MNVLDELNLFYTEFNGEKGYLGRTERGENIPFFKVKKTEKPIVIIAYGIHAREYITTYLALKQIDEYKINGKKGTVYFVPALNIDGIKICLTLNPLYKANAKGVDLNVNFSAKWGSGESNVKSAGSENYIGPFPFSESETRAIRDFTLKVNPDITLSYHSKGEEIYWYFYQEEKQRDYSIAKRLAKSTGYRLRTLLNSSGGYKDWCIERLKIPSFTVEVGGDELSHPIGKENLEKIYLQNKRVLEILTDYDG